MDIQNNNLPDQSQAKPARAAWLQGLRWGISGLCIVLIVWRLQDAKSADLLRAIRTTTGLQLLAGLGAVMLVTANLGLEAARWRLCLTPVEPRSWRSHLAAVVAGITVGLPFTHLVGDYSGKLALARRHAPEAAPLLVATSFAQYLVSFGGGIGALWLLYQSSHLQDHIVVPAQILTLWLFLLLNAFLALPWVYQAARQLPFAWAQKLPKKIVWPPLWGLLGLSVLRYGVILAQYALLFYLFAPHGSVNVFLAGIAITLGVKTLVPFLSIGGMIGLRELLALTVFSSMGFPDAGAVIVAVSLGVWLINVAGPALVGTAVLSRIKSSAWWQL